MKVAKASFPREHFGDAQLDRLQSEVQRLRAIIAACPFINGSLVEESVTTSATRVIHRLGRVPNGVIVLKVSPDSAIGFSTSQPSDPINAVNLEASANADFTLWFW
jgi:hypothetical protein